MKILILLLFFPILVFSQAPDFEYSFTETGNNFGFRMTQNDNYLFVGGVNKVFVYLKNNPSLDLVQELSIPVDIGLSCDQAYSNNGIAIPINRFEHYGENYFIEFESKNSGSYYLITKPDFISSSQSIVENIKNIELAQNPVSKYCIF